MPAADADSVTGRSPTTRNGVLSPGLSSVSLSREHITEALTKSPDRGATLDLTHKNLTDVGEDGAEELATVVRDIDDQTDSTVARYVISASSGVWDPRQVHFPEYHWPTIVLPLFPWPSHFFLAYGISF